MKKFNIFARGLLILLGLLIVSLFFFAQFRVDINQSYENLNARRCAELFSYQDNAAFQKELKELGCLEQEVICTEGMVCHFD